MKWLSASFWQSRSGAQNFAATWKRFCIETGVHDIHEKGTVAGTVHRIWARLKSTLGGGDHTLLSTEAIENSVFEAYENALSSNLPLNMRQVLRAQRHMSSCRITMCPLPGTILRAALRKCPRPKIEVRQPFFCNFKLYSAQGTKRLLCSLYSSIRPLRMS